MNGKTTFTKLAKKRISKLHRIYQKGIEMKKNTSLIFTLLPSVVISILTSQTVLAAPSITSVETKGSELIISGTGFGTKPKPAPYRYDNWESANIGQTPSQATVGFWLDGVGGRGTTASVKGLSRHPRSGKSMSIDFGAARATGNGDAVFERYEKFEKLYINFWVRPDWGKPDPDGSWQIKYFRLNHDYPSIAAFGWARKNGSLTRTEWQHLTYNKDVCGGTTKTVYQALPLGPKWVNISLAVDQSNMKAVKSIIMQSQENHTGPYFSVTNTHNFLGQCSSPVKLELIKFGGSAQSGATSGIWYFDDIYIDNTWARVEIGNASSYENCTHREVQIPSAWADKTITVTANPGSFTAGTEAFLFVVDSNGLPSPGRKITIGSTSVSEPATSKPSPPTSLRIQ